MPFFLVVTSPDVYRSFLIILILLVGWETCKEHGRFVRAEKGDEESARKRWLKTMEWRKAEGIDTILCEPHPHFNIIKANYPHYYYGRSKTGNPLYVDKPGGIDLKILRENGITLDDLLRQLVFR